MDSLFRGECDTGLVAPSRKGTNSDNGTRWMLIERHLVHSGRKVRAQDIISRVKPLLRSHSNTLLIPFTGKGSHSDDGA